MITVDVHNLTVKFGDFTAVDNISFNVSGSEIFGFLGANGAGKTTTIRVLCGLLEPTSGQVSVVGNNVNGGQFAIKSKVGYMSQKFTLYNDLTVKENLDFIAALRKLRRNQYLRSRKELFDFIEFDRSINTIVRDLPGGIKHQVSLAAALLHNPEIIFLDEPTAGVSPLSRARFWSLIKKLSDNGKTVFVTTHFLDEAEQCNRIALMRQGKIAALDTPNNLKTKTFSTPMFEFDPKKTMSFAEISDLKQNSIFSFFEPYGRRFHASFIDKSNWQQQMNDFKTKFNVIEIEPSLEDVFIKTIEAKQ